MSEEELKKLYEKKALKIAKRVLGEFGYRIQGNSFDNCIILDANNNRLEKGNSGFADSYGRVYLNGYCYEECTYDGIRIAVEDASGLCFYYKEPMILNRSSMTPDECRVKLKQEGNKIIEIIFEVNYANPSSDLYKGNINIFIKKDGNVYDFYEIYCVQNYIRCYHGENNKPTIGKSADIIKANIIDIIGKEYTDDGKVRFFVLNLLKEYKRAFDRLNEHFKANKEYYIASLQREVDAFDSQIAEIEKKKASTLSKIKKLEPEKNNNE